MDGPAFAILDKHGQVVGITAELGGAIELAEDLAGPHGSVHIDTDDESETALLAANDVVPIRSKASADALRGSALPTAPFAEVMAMPLEVAWEQLRPYFPTRRFLEGRRAPIVGYDTPSRMASNWLGQNFKTSKDTPQPVKAMIQQRTGGRMSEANVMGLSLLPHSLLSKSPNVEEFRGRLARSFGVRAFELPVTERAHVNVCVRSTPACRRSCLVFSGQNVNRYTTVKKICLSQALIGAPLAFYRMLAEAIEQHRRWGAKKDIMPLVRLNVFSDLPWELLVPGLFEHFSDVQFYDYTKVPGRTTAANYDITFSFAGSKQNVDDMDAEIRTRRRRVAVVFATTGVSLIGGRRGGKKRQLVAPRKPEVLPHTFLGLPVIDGDESDLRPFDPAPSVVGLRWKIPKNQAVDLIEADVFIVRGAIVEGSFVAAETPLQTVGGRVADTTDKPWVGLDYSDV